MAIILTDIIVGEGLATVEQVRAAMAACGKDESRLPSALAARGLLYGEKLEALYELAACRAAEDAEGAAAAKARLRRPPSPPVPLPPPPADLEEARKDPARAFGPFTLLQEIGRGPKGTVHRAWRPDPGRQVAVKIHSAERSGEPDRARLALGIQAAGKLRHAHILRIHDTGQLSGRLYLAMEFAEGNSMADLIAQGRIPWRTAAAAIAECAMAVQFAHDHGVVHRDVRPENILLDRSGRALLLGFGAAGDPEDPASGPALHLSPEQIEGRAADIDARSDVYGLGCALYHAVAGVPPYPTADFAALFDRVRSAVPDPPSRKLAGAPPELDAIILRCLEKKPGDRYGRAFDLAVDLRRLLRGLRPLTAPPASLTRRKASPVDELTGLRSRRALLREMDARLAGSFSVVLFDVDQFRPLADREGRDAFELRLRKIAGILADLPGAGAAAGRHGADSFLCVLPGIEKTAATAFAEKVRGAVALIGVTVSAGVAASPADGAGLFPTLRAARLALGQAKGTGRDRVVAAVRREADLSTVLPPRALKGRDADLAAAGALFDPVRRGQPAMMILEGDAGTGKSRLLHELSARARAAGLLPLAATCDDARRFMPGAALLSLVQEFYARREAAQKALRARLTKPQRFVLREGVPCFRSWAPDLPAPNGRDAAAQLPSALDAALRAMAGDMPLLLLLDNAPAGDALSYTILRDLIRDGTLPIGIVLALQGLFSALDERSSDPALPVLWQEAERHTAKLLRASPLSPDQTEALVCTILEGADLPDGFPERIAAATKGNPLHLEAVLRGLGARGKIGRERRAWKIEPITALELPASLDQAVGQLSDGLPPAATELFDVAAAMSAVLDVDALLALGSWSEPEVLDLLDLLEERGIVTAGATGTFEFASGTARDARVRTIPAPRLQELRARTAQALLDLYGLSPPERPAPAPAPAGLPPPPPAMQPLGDAGMDAAIRFIQAITTELKMGRLYPKDSRMRVELRERLLESAREMTGASPRVTIAAGPQGVRANDAPLPPSGEGAGRSLVQLFQEKALAALTLDSGVTNGELFQLLDALGAPLAKEAAAPDHWDRVKLPHVALAPVRTAPAAAAPAVVRPKTPEIEETARALMALPAAKLTSLDTEKSLPATFDALVEAKLQRLMDPIVDRLGAALRDPEAGPRRQAVALVTRILEQGSPAAREILLRRLESPIAGSAAVETDDLTFALFGNAVRAWLATATALKQPRLLVGFAARLASAPELLRRSAAMKGAIAGTLASMPAATEEVTDLFAKADGSQREGATRIAVLMGAAMVHPLVSLILTHADVTARRLAGTTLKEIGDGRRQLAAQVKADTPPHVARNVLSVFELTGAGGAEIAAVMHVAANHADASVREAAGALLVRAKSLFTPLQMSELLDRPEAVLQKSAIQAAKELRMREAGGGVLKIAETTQDEDMLRTACNYFRECPTAEALPLLSKLFASKARAFGLLKGMSDSTRVAATEALRKLNHPDARRIIDQALNDGSETVRRAAKPSSGP